MTWPALCVLHVTSNFLPLHVVLYSGDCMLAMGTLLYNTAERHETFLMHYDHILNSCTTHATNQLESTDVYRWKQWNRYIRKIRTTVPCIYATTPGLVVASGCSHDSLAIAKCMHIIPIVVTCNCLSHGQKKRAASLPLHPCFTIRSIEWWCISVLMQHRYPSPLLGLSPKTSSQFPSL